MSWIPTYTGKRFDFNKPEECQFTLSDIVWPLAKLCRFTGHCKRFYSVAEHSLNAAYFAPDELRYPVLVHDTAEAFLGDVSHPLKEMLPDYQAIEKRVEAAVFARLGLPNGLPPEYKTYDHRMLVTERKFLLTDQTTVWEDFKHLEPFNIEFMHPRGIEHTAEVFAQVFRSLAPSQVVENLKDDSI